MYCEIKDRLNELAVRQILSHCLGDKTPEGIDRALNKYQDEQFYGWLENSELVAVCGFRVLQDRVEICHIAVAENARGKGIGRKIITVLREKTGMAIEAETNDEAVEFYRKCGFETTVLWKEHGGQKYQRWICVLKEKRRAKNIITIQHTQSVHHNTGMVGSWTDWELTDLGKEHAENIGRTLSDELKGQAYKIYSSDLARARQTVEPLAKYMGVEIEYNKKLREMNLGNAVGKTGEWAKANAAKDWSRHKFDVQEFPGAETWREFWNRVSDLCRDIVADEAENIILASHGVTLSVWQQVWLGSEIMEFEYVGLPGGVSFMGITEKGSRIIRRWNDSSYMKGITK